MTYTTIRRLASALILTTVLGGTARAAQTSKTPAKAEAPQTSVAASQKPVFEETNARGTKQVLARILQQYPPSLGEVLRRDPSLALNRDYLAPYPVLAEFLAQHSEIAHNPAFFFGYPDYTPEPSNDTVRAIQSITEPLSAVIAFVSALCVIAFVIKTVMDHRRWRRATAVQAEAHTKLLDRFTSNEELLAYTQSPAGRHFLESTPIHFEGNSSMAAPINRILWSVQVGLVLTAAGIGLNWAIPTDVSRDATIPMTIMSIMAMSLGIGFVISAGASYVISQRLGLLERPQPKETQTQP